jgi:hypothetical protein
MEPLGDLDDRVMLWLGRDAHGPSPAVTNES